MVRDRILAHLGKDWVTAALGFVTAVVVVVTLVGAVVYGSDILKATTAVRDGSDLTGCRSSYNAAVVDRRTDFDIARSKRDTADAEVDIVLLEIAEASIFGDQATVGRLRASLPPLRAAIIAANEIVEDAQDALMEANEGYQAAVELSRADPARFIRRCKSAEL